MPPLELWQVKMHLIALSEIWGEPQSDMPNKACFKVSFSSRQWLYIHLDRRFVPRKLSFKREKAWNN
jgi:hypothetical protein